MSNKIDKLRSTYPLEIKFYPGEQPSAAKLSAISSQAKSGLNVIEKAIGDIWGTGHSNKGLHQTNLGRVLGDAKYINPALSNIGTEKFYYLETLPTGVTNGYLTFRPSDDVTDALTYIKFSEDGGATESLNYNVNENSSFKEEDVVQDSPDVFVDPQNGRFRTGKLTSSGLIVGYYVDPTEWIQGSEDFFPSIIPDPRSGSGNQFVTVTFNAATNYYELTIPKRLPLEANVNEAFKADLPHRRLKKCGTTDLNDQANLAALYDEYTPKVWNSSANAAPFHYYSWPDKGTLDEGSIYLWNHNANSIVEGLEFTINGTGVSKINITDTKGRLAQAISDSHTFYLITHGSSVSRTIWSLATGLANHDHTGTTYNEKNLDHSKFLNLAPAVDTQNVVWEKSSQVNDDHIQYLHRDTTDARDSNKGAMISDIIIGQTTEVAGSYLGDLSADTSNKIWFGENIEGTNTCIFGTLGAVAIGGPSPKLDFREASQNTVRFESNANVFYFKKGFDQYTGTTEPTGTVFQINEEGQTLFNTTENTRNAVVAIRDSGSAATSGTPSSYAAQLKGDTLVESGSLFVSSSSIPQVFSGYNLFSDTGVRAPKISSFSFEVTAASNSAHPEKFVNLFGEHIGVGIEDYAGAVFADESSNWIMSCHYNTAESKARVAVLGDLTVTGNLNTEYITNDSQVVFAHSDGNNTSMDVKIENGQLFCDGIFSDGSIHCGNGNAANIKTDNGNIFTESGWIYAMGTTEAANNGCKIICFQGEDLVDDASHTPNNGFQLVRPQGSAGNPHALGNLGDDYWNILIGSSGNLHFTQKGFSKGFLRGDQQASANTTQDIERITGMSGNFTGQHTVISENKNIQENINDHIGLIVSSIGQYRNVQLEESIPEETITINESLPMIQLASEQKDKKVFGVISDAEDPNSSREYASGTFVSILPKMEGDDRITVNSLGEGGIWVSNINGNLENGDYITSCEVPGYGMKQDDDLLHNYTVAKITCDCNFDLNSTVYNCEEFTFEGATYRKAFVGCTYHCG